MSRTRIKICGITRPEDAALACELGADAIGMNFIGGPRRIEMKRAREIAGALMPGVTAVALCRKKSQRYPDAFSNEQLQREHPAFPCSTVQFYDMDDQFEDPSGRWNYWRVVHVGTLDDLRQAEVHFSGSSPIAPQAVVLDTAVEGTPGGSGKSFDWNWIAAARAKGYLDLFPPVILAGGLTPENVADAIRIAQPYAVDVSSGVEVAGKPGLKDALKLRDFIQAVDGAG